jgi:hypothetical protein
MLNSRPLLVAVALLLLAVSAFLIWQRVGGSPERVAERELARGYDESSDVRRQHVRCVALADLPWDVACTYQEIRLDGLDDRPLMLAGVGVSGPRIVKSTGVMPLALRCASNVRCWVKRLCRLDECPKLSGIDFPTLGRNAPPRRLTAATCVGAWNVHGGFASVDPTFASSATPPQRAGAAGERAALSGDRLPRALPG